MATGKYAGTSHGEEAAGQGQILLLTRGETGIHRYTLVASEKPQKRQAHSQTCCGKRTSIAATKARHGMRQADAQQQTRGGAEDNAAGRLERTPKSFNNQR